MKARNVMMAVAMLLVIGGLTANNAAASVNYLGCRQATDGIHGCRYGRDVRPGVQFFPHFYQVIRGQRRHVHRVRRAVDGYRVLAARRSVYRRSFSDHV